MRLLLAVAMAGVIGTVTAGGLGYWRGHVSGVEAERFKQEQARQEMQRELFELGDEISRQASQIERLRRDRAAIIIDLENEAYSAPGADNPGIGADGLRRLERRWGAP